MARFVIEVTVTDHNGPDWAKLEQWTMDGRSVELVGVRQSNGDYHIEVRRWTGFRDDTDTDGNKSNSQRASAAKSYKCR